MSTSPELPPRQLHGQTLMRLLIHSGPLTRVELATRAGLSKQTVSEVVRELEDDGWVRVTGRIVGRVGRSPVQYEFNARSGFVVGIDLGATKLRVAIADLAGAVLREESVPVDRRGGPHLIDAIVHVTRELARQSAVQWNEVRTVAIGTPGIVDPTSGVIRLASNVPEFRDMRLREELQARFDVPVLADNEVNMSVLAERWLGHGEDCENFLALEVGTGVGMGVLLDGEIRRGSRGAAGEVAFLPLGGDAFDRDAQRRGVFENATCSEALLRRYNEAGGAATTAHAVFEAAAAGEQIARDALDEQARLLALCICTTATVLDPELVVLGGGIGARPELLEPVRRWLADLMATPPRVETSGLGNRATLVGALAAALRSAHRSMFGDPAGLPSPYSDTRMQGTPGKVKVGTPQ